MIIENDIFERLPQQRGFDSRVNRPFDDSRRSEAMKSSPNPTVDVLHAHVPAVTKSNPIPLPCSRNIPSVVEPRGF